MKYRADIDGLRAIAVVSVIAFHFGGTWLPGGFIGVDIFFVISGFLLSSIIRHEIAEGTFSIVRFYARRVRRIYPALVCVYVASLAFACLALPPLKFVTFGRTLLGASFFFNNIVFMKTIMEGGYFNSLLEKPMLLHTWSLSVEEQFYIFIPGLLLLLSVFSRRRRLLCLAAICLVSLLFSSSKVVDAPNAAFYTLFSRAWELLFGVALAEAYGRLPDRRWIRESLGAGGLAALIYSVICISPEQPFPGYTALFPVVGTSMLILAGPGEASLVSRLLATPPFRLVGKISYSLYLWHWPVLVAINTLTLTKMGPARVALAVGLTSLLAVCSYRYVEEPFRRRRVLAANSRLFAVALSSTLVFGGIGLALILDHGWPTRFASTDLRIIEANEKIAGDFTKDPLECLNWQKDVGSLSNVPQCPIGGAGAKKILIWGDSHAFQLYSVMKTLYAADELGGRGATFMVSAGCPPSVSIEFSSNRCALFSRLALQRAEQPDIDTVLIMFQGGYGLEWWEPGMLVVEEGRKKSIGNWGEANAAFLNDLRTYAHILKAQGKHVIIALPQPMYEQSIPDLLISNVILRRFGVQHAPKRLDFVAFRHELRNLIDATGVGVFDPRKSLCRGDVCQYETDGLSLYRDTNHLPGSHSAIFKDELLRALSAAPAK